MTKGEYIAVLEAKNHALQISLQETQQQVEWLKHQLAELKRLVFGSKRERFIAPIPGQPTLFEVPAQEPVAEPIEEITYTRKKQAEKKHPFRAELPAYLPRVEEIIEPEGIPEGAKKIGESVTEILEYNPGNIYVRKIIRPKYITSSSDEKTEITIANLPSLPIPKSNAGASLLSYITVSKYVDHMPIYRLAQMLKRQGVPIPESTLGGWVSGTWRTLDPLYPVLQKKIFTANYLMVDETPIPVLTKDKPGSTHKGFYWIYYDPVNKLVLFDYRESRGREGPDQMLENFKGYLQTDGYNAYDNLKIKEKIIHLGCMAHARRKFEHAKNNDPERAEKALTMIQKLYEIERICREEEYSVEQIRQFRQEKSAPELIKIEEWLKDQIYKVNPQSAIGKAIAYTLKLWPRLEQYIKDGRLQIDNNLIENSIRPVAIGRKNYLFAGSHEAARKAAMIYSFFAICKLKGIDPYQWLKITLEKINNYPENLLEELLP
jgi:transposase